MNTLLVKNRPKDTTKEEFEKVWNNIGYSLSALYFTLKDLQMSSSRVKKDDFSIPNHYAMLAYEAGKQAAYQEIVDMLPDNAKF